MQSVPDPGPSPRGVHDRRSLRLALVLAVLATCIALVAVDHRARTGRNALVKWTWAIEAAEAGAPLYGAGESSPGPYAEGFPTLPVTLLLLRPFHALGPRFAPVVWAGFCAALAWFIVLMALRGAEPRAVRDGPVVPWRGAGALTVLAVTGRILYSELQHGNVNLVVGALVAAGVAAWAALRPTTAGVWLGVAAVVKVTPALALVWWLGLRSGRAILGFFLGLAAAAWLWPGAVFGLTKNAEYVQAWWLQMAAPYLSGRELTYLQTTHVNQSLLGVLARWCTDAVAIEARPPVHLEDIRIGLLSLPPDTLHTLHRWLALPIVAAVYWGGRRAVRCGAERRQVFGSASLLVLAMLLLSERSWKHHFVLLPLPVAYLAWSAFAARSRGAQAALAWAGIAIVGTGDGLLGARGADLAEAYGAYFSAAMALFVAVAWELARASSPASCRDEGAGARPTTGT